jgi:hypothetical protein
MSYNPDLQTPAGGETSRIRFSELFSTPNEKLENSVGQVGMERTVQGRNEALLPRINAPAPSGVGFTRTPLGGELLELMAGGQKGLEAFVPDYVPPPASFSDASEPAGPTADARWPVYEFGEMQKVVREGPGPSADHVDRQESFRRQNTAQHQGPIALYFSQAN